MADNSNLYDDPMPVKRVWWFLIALVAIYGFGVLITITSKAYREKPPIPAQVVDREGNLIFTMDDVKQGQNVFLSYGLQDNLLPTGFIQLGDVVENGYWHARSMEFTQSPLMTALGWARMPADLIFILLGAVPLFIGSMLAWIKQK